MKKCLNDPVVGCGRQGLSQGLEIPVILVYFIIP